MGEGVSLAMKQAVWRRFSSSVGVGAFAKDGRILLLCVSADFVAVVRRGATSWRVAGPSAIAASYWHLPVRSVPGTRWFR